MSLAARLRLHPRLLLLLLLLTLGTSALGVSPHTFSHRQHPLVARFPRLRLQPPLLAWYSTRSDPVYREREMANGLYRPRASRYRLRAPGAGAGAALAAGGADVLAVVGRQVRWADWLTLGLSRDAQVCLGLLGDPELFAEGKVWMRNWTDRGVATWRGDAPPERVGARVRLMCRRFDRASAGPARVVSLPSPALLRAVVPSLRRAQIDMYTVVLAEADGSPSKPPATPGPAAGARPNAPCPPKMHDLWTASSNDPEVRNRKFASWHPQIDPIYWCYYGHEHGSYPGLAAYSPKFNYLAWKNNRENESHNGFKGYVVPIGMHNFYFSVHAKTSSLRRVHTVHHSVVIAATHKKTGQLMLELSCKASFGFSAATRADIQADMLPIEKRVPLGAEEAALMKRLFGGSGGVPSKTINVLAPDDDDQDERVATNERNRAAGLYEVWKGAFPCMRFANPQFPGPAVDIKDPGTACRSLACPPAPAQAVPLGTPVRGAFRRHRGTLRGIALKRLRLEPAACPFGRPPRRGDGVFYTDPYCRRRLPGPGKGAVRQVWRAGFVARLDGDYGTKDMWGRLPYERIPDGPPKRRRVRSLVLHGFRDLEYALSAENA